MRTGWKRWFPRQRAVARAPGSAAEPVTSATTADVLVSAALACVPRITDGVIVLDALGGADADALAAMDDEATRRAYGPLEGYTVLTPEGARALIASWTEDWLREGERRVFAVRREGALVGVVEARIGAGGWRADLGVRIAPTARRQGLGSRAMRLAADYAADILGVSRLRIETDDANRPARAMAGSLGLKELDPSSSRPGRVAYGLTHEDWEVRSRDLADRLGQGTIA